ncbi:MAG TPA: ABC transporter permease [Ktedonobacterales bacterium]|jgi:ABC-type lipoprotein release transport system permease subunit|nr:ABC transporter permease [Ktedonobacterales bacterium]
MRPLPAAAEPRGKRTPQGFGAVTDLSRSPRFTAISAASWLAARRARSGWRILLAVVIDMLVVVILVCVIPIYTNLLTALALQSQLSALSIGGRNVDVTIVHTHLTGELQSQEQQIVTTLAHSTLARFAPDPPTNYLVAAPQLMTQRNYSPPANLTQIQFDAYQNHQLLPHIRLLSGEPLPASSAAQDYPPALVTQQMTQVDSVQVGDLLTVLSGQYFQQTFLTVRVVGVWAPRDVNDPFWNGHSFLSLPQFDSDPFIFPVLVPPSMLAPMLSSLSQAIVTQHWTFTTRVSTLTPADIPAVTTGLTHFRTGLAAALARKNYIVSVLTITGLDKTLTAVAEQQRRFALPVESVGALTVGAALLLLALVAHLFVDRDRALIATVRSRGASGGQILGAYMALITAAGAFATLVGAMFALYLAPQFVQHIVSPAALRGASVSSAYLTSLVKPTEVVVPALTCLLLAIGICFWVGLNTLQSNIRSLALSEVDGSAGPFWQRFYLDLMLAAVCAFGYLDLTYYGSAQVQSAVSQTTPSPLLVATPLLLLLTVILLLLRVFPLVATLWLRIATRRRGPTGILATMRLTRGSTQVTLQSLIAMLAIGVIVLAVTYDVTVQQNAMKQAAYQAGADVRLVESQPETPGADALIRSRIAQLPGHTAVSSAYRGVLHTSAFWNVLGSTQGGAGLLAIDPHTWQNALAAEAWQPGDASEPLSSLMAKMAAHELAAPASTHAGASDHPLWVIVSRDFAQSQHHKVGDTFTLILPDSTTQSAYVVIGAIVNDFPTLNTTGSNAGFVVADESDFLAALRAQPGASSAAIGPNEYWLRSSESDAFAVEALRQALQLDATTIIARQSLEAAILDTPALIGLRALLIFAAVAIGLLTVLAAGLQTTLDVGQRWTQMMTLRALGLSRIQLIVVLIGERFFAALFGIAGGLVAGWALTITTLPYLQVSNSSATLQEATDVSVATNPWLLALIIFALVGAMLLETATLSIRAARSPISLRTLAGKG